VRTALEIADDVMEADKRLAGRELFQLLLKVTDGRGSSGILHLKCAGGFENKHRQERKRYPNCPANRNQV
jgi:hypothetical protein